MESQLGDDDVEVRESWIVVPSEPTSKHTLSLSTVDAYQLPWRTFEYLLVYENTGDLSCRHDQVGRQAAFTSRLKRALGRALAQYYPLAGRVEEGPDGLHVVFGARGEGVPFYEAVSGGYTRHSFERGPRLMGEWRPLLGRQVDDVLKGDPLLVVQLTWLADGSAALAFGFSHCLCDGSGGAQFLRSLAEMTHGAATACEPHPVWDRHLLVPSPEEPEPDIQDYPQFLEIDDVCGFVDRFKNETLVPTSYDFTKSDIDRLKSSSSSSSFTSFEVISAHIWRCWAKASGLPPAQVTRLRFPVNFRGRAKTGLPAGYYGNAIIAGYAQTTVGELTGEGPGYGPGLVREGKERVDDRYVRDVIRLNSRNHKAANWVATLVVTSWTSFGLDRLDFGLGQPAYAGPISSDDICHVVPIPNQPDGARVLLCVPSSIVEVYRDLIPIH